MSTCFDKLIPARFLTLIAHLAITVIVLWSSRASATICLPEEYSQRDLNKQRNQLVWGMSLSVTLIVIELLAFLIGLTMFHQSSALLSIGAHGCACLAISYLVMDGMQCGWYWIVFGLFTVPPVLHDSFLITDIIGWTKLLILTGISTTIGSSLTVGYNIGVVNSPAKVLLMLIKVFCNNSVEAHYGYVLTTQGVDILWSAVVSIFLIGGAIGSLSGSFLADKFGRKGGIFVSNIIAICSGLCFICCKIALSVELLIFGRLLVGFSSGLATCIVPMYLMELAPLQQRGAVGVLCPLGVTFGVLVGQVMSLSNIMGREEYWPYLLGLYLIFVLLLTLTFPLLPESPKYLYFVRKDRRAAFLQLERLRNKGQEQLTSDLIELQAEKPIDSSDEWRMGKMVTTPELRLPILLVCCMQAGQQFSGINAVFYYSVSIFISAGLSQEQSELATIGAGVINLGMAIISIPVMSRFNRRSTFQLSAGTSAVFLALLGIAITHIDTISWMPYVSIIGVLGFVLCYGIGLGPIPYFIGSELFEVGPRPCAMALGSMANWGGNFIVGMTFPTFKNLIGPATFFIFSAVAVFLCIFIRLYLPETRGRDPSLIRDRRTAPTSPILSLSTTDTDAAFDDQIKCP